MIGRLICVELLSGVMRLGGGALSAGGGQGNGCSGAAQYQSPDDINLHHGEEAQSPP